jgi:hypothetical protein
MMLRKSYEKNASHVTLAKKTILPHAQFYDFVMTCRQPVLRLRGEYLRGISSGTNEKKRKSLKLHAIKKLSSRSFYEVKSKNNI